MNQAAQSEPATVRGTLTHGLRIGDTTHKEFVMREALAGDYFAADSDASPDKFMSYRGACIAQQLVSIGTFTGPFSLAMLAKLRNKDFAILLAKQQELDKLGEVPQLDEAIS